MKTHLKRLMKLGFVLGAAAAALTLWRKLTRSAPPGGRAPEERLEIRNEENLSGVGLVMDNMISSYLDDPAKAKMLDGINLVVAIEPVEEPLSAITMSFANGRVVIEPGVDPRAGVIIACDYDVLMELPKMGVGPRTIAYLMTPEGKEVVRKFLTGQIGIKGAPLHAMGLIKLTRFLEVPSEGA